MSLLQFDPLAWAVLGVAGLLLGLAGLLVRSRRRAPWRNAAPGGVCLLLGVAALACGQPGWLCEPLLAAAAIDGILTLLRTRPVWASLGRKTVQSGAMFLACAALLGWQLCRMDAAPDADLDPGQFATVTPPELSGPPAYLARTDAGREVPLYAVPAPTEGAAPWRRTATFHQVIQTGPADPCYNCHGWVFAAGRYWVRGGEVETILADNGYHATTAPRPGDIAVFRAATGEVTHSGVVVGAAEGAVVLESKWGQTGRYVHTATDHAYHDDRATYYTTPRGGHLLRGMDEAPRPMPAAIVNSSPHAAHQ